IGRPAWGLSSFASFVCCFTNGCANAAPAGIATRQSGAAIRRILLGISALFLSGRRPFERATTCFGMRGLETAALGATHGPRAPTGTLVAPSKRASTGDRVLLLEYAETHLLYIRCNHDRPASHPSPWSGDDGPGSAVRYGPRVEPDAVVVGAGPNGLV